MLVLLLIILNAVIAIALGYWLWNLAKRWHAFCRDLIFCWNEEKEKESFNSGWGALLICVMFCSAIVIGFSVLALWVAWAFYLWGAIFHAFGEFKANVILWCYAVLCFRIVQALPFFAGKAVERLCELRHSWVIRDSFYDWMKRSGIEAACLVFDCALFFLILTSPAWFYVKKAVY